MIKSDPQDQWIKKTGHFDRQIMKCRAGVELIAPVLSESNIPPLKILFFTDLHWRGSECWHSPLLSLIQDEQPDIVFFGGDLAHHFCVLPEAIHFLSQIPARIGKFATCGNWERRRKNWFSHSRLKALYAQAGFTLCCNEWIIYQDLAFYFPDDIKKGNPQWQSCPIQPRWSAMISHNPDTVISMPWDQLKTSVNLILCGHTHGGQWRIPPFGAIFASSRYGKRFAYGVYYHSVYTSNMVISSGLGNTMWNSRICCPKEILTFEKQ